MAENYRHIGEMNYDGLITDIEPAVRIRGGVIAASEGEVTYRRGTIFAKSSTDGTLYMLGTEAGEGGTLTPDCVLCDDITVPAGETRPTAVYTAGCFDPDKVIVADGYTMTAADKDALRIRNIDFKAAQK